MKFIKEYKIFESIDSMPEIGSKWIKDDKKVTVLKPDHRGNVTFYYDNDPEYNRYLKPVDFYKDYKPYSHNYRDEYNFDFDKAVYLSDERAIIGAYFITKTNEKSIEILNIKEFPSDKGTFGDNARPYSVTFHKGTYPTSQIEILGEVPDRPGFSYIKVPYWLYKETPELNIKRCIGDFHKMKRLDLIGKSFSDKDFRANFKDPNVIKYFSSSDKDERTQQQVINYGR